MPDRWIRDHVGDEASPRPGFEEELADSLRAAWRSGEVAPARVPIDAAGRPRRRPRWPIVAGIGTAAALLAVLTAVAIARDDGSAPRPATPSPATSAPAPIPTAPPDTTAATGRPTPTSPTTAPRTSTTPATTAPVASTMPTELVPADAPEGFYPACAERGGVAASSEVTAPPTFGPLAADPALTVLLPASVGPVDYPAAQRITSPKGTATLIPGGVLIALNQANGDGSSLLAAVNLDGSVRWVRCTAADQVVSPYDIVGSNAPGATAFVRRRDASHLGTPDPDMVEVNLQTGEFGPTLAERVAEANPWLDGASARTLVGQSRTHLLLASFGVLSGQDDVLLLVDRTTLIAERLPDAGASTDNRQSPSLDEAGRPVLTVSTPAGPQVVAVYDGTVWSADIRSAAAPRVAVGDDPATGGSALSFLDGEGGTVWRRDDLAGWRGEGFSAAVAGDVTIARVCADAPDCSRWDVVGLRTADGGEIWRFVAPDDGGAWGVGPLGDGFALLQEPMGTAVDGSSTGGAWVMVEIATGQVLDGQRWEDPTTFEAQCCGGGEFVHVRRNGGVLVAVNERRISVWFPDGTRLAPATATLP